MFINVQLSQEAKMMPKITHFPRYAITLKKKHQFSQGYFYGGTFRAFIIFILENIFRGHD